MKRYKFSVPIIVTITMIIILGHDNTTLSDLSTCLSRNHKHSRITEHNSYVCSQDQQTSRSLEVHPQGAAGPTYDAGHRQQDPEGSHRHQEPLEVNFVLMEEGSCDGHVLLCGYGEDSYA